MHIYHYPLKTCIYNKILGLLKIYWYYKMVYKTIAKDYDEICDNY